MVRTNLRKQHADERESQYFSLNTVTGYGDIQQQASLRQQAAENRWLASVSGGEGDWRQAIGEAQEEYANAFAEDRQAWINVSLPAARDYALQRVAAKTDRQLAVVNAFQDYQDELASTLSAAVSAFAILHPSPWASQMDDQTSAKAERDIAKSNAESDKLQSQISRDENQEIDEIWLRYMRDLTTETGNIERLRNSELASAGRQLQQGESLSRWSSNTLTSIPMPFTGSINSVSTTGRPASSTHFIVPESALSGQAYANHVPEDSHELCDLVAESLNDQLFRPPLQQSFFRRAKLSIRAKWPGKTQ